METKPTISPLIEKNEPENALKNTFSEHGSEITEIISYKLPFIVRWGTVFFLILILSIASICWFIRYPDIVTGKAILTGMNTPKEVINRTAGRLHLIYVKEGDTVKEGCLLGSMESIADANVVLQTRNQLDTIANLIADNRTDEIVKYLPTQRASAALPEQQGTLGELQQPYEAFAHAFITFRDFLSTGYYLRKKKMLEQDLQTMLKMHAALNEQQILLDRDLDLTNLTFKANENLYKQKVIASFEFRTEQSKLIGKQLTLPQAVTALLSNESQQNEKRKEIAELENQVLVQKNTFIQALHTMQGEVQEWEKKFLLKAPLSGTVALAGFYEANQELQANQTLFYIQPANSSYFVKLLIPQYNFGKVKNGQVVQLKFTAYPYEQYGQLIGTIASISKMPSDSGYLAKVVLPNGLVTNYKKQLQYHNGLQAQADIVTQDMRLLERFYYGLIKQFTP